MLSLKPSVKPANTYPALALQCSLNVRAADLCIMGFHRLGYDASFAGESFNARLKANGDESSHQSLPLQIAEETR